MSGSKRIAHRDLVQFFKDALGAVGVPPHVAQIEAEIGAEVDFLLSAELIFVRVWIGGQLHF